MMERVSRDRLHPALLDRLTDDAPQACMGPSAYQVGSMKPLRASVLRDLSNLLNAHSLYGCAGIAAYPLVEASVVNYGLRDVTGNALSSLDVAALARDIARAIVRFEPRIAADTLRVTPLDAALASRCASVAFLVEGDLWAMPDPERLYFKTELDLESGQTRIVDDMPRTMQRRKR